MSTALFRAFGRAFYCGIGWLLAGFSYGARDTIGDAARVFSSVLVGSLVAELITWGAPLAWNSRRQART